MKHAEKFILYLRKSSEGEDRQVQSIPDQRRELQPVAERLKITIIEEITESQSAKKEGRPGFAKMVRMLKSGQADGIICWKLNRLSRNPRDGGEVQALLQEGVLQSIVTPSHTYLPTDNFLLMAVELGMANQYSIDLGRDSKRGMQGMAKRGWFPAGAKPGYMYDPMAERGHKTILIDSDRFAHIQRTFKLIINGTLTPPQALEKLNTEWGYRTPQKKKQGGKPMGKSCFYHMLSDSFYYGDFEYPDGSGQWYEGKHQPIISREEFDHLQMLLGRKGKPRPQRHQHTYSGLFTCGACDAVITPDEKWQVRCTECKHKFSSIKCKECPKCETPIDKMTNPTIRHYLYYQCKNWRDMCRKESLEVTKIEEQVHEILSRVRVREEFEQWIIDKISKDNSQEATHRTAAIKSLQAAYDDTQKRADNLMAMKISPQNSDGSLLSDEEYKERKGELLTDKKRISDQINQTKYRTDDWMEDIEKAFTATRYARHWLLNGTDEQKRDIVRMLGSNLQISDRRLRIGEESYVLEIDKAAAQNPSILEEFEPENSLTRKLDDANLENIWDRSPSLLATPVSNPKSDTNGGF